MTEDTKVPLWKKAVDEERAKKAAAIPGNEPWRSIPSVVAAIPEPDVYPADQYTEAVKGAIKTADFYSVYAEFVQGAKLGRKGKEQQFSCPVPTNHTHGDKNPSASIDLSTGEWKCHGCEIGGDLITLAALGLGYGINDYNTREYWPKFIEEAGERLGITKEPEPASPAPDAGPKVLTLRPGLAQALALYFSSLKTGRSQPHFPNSGKLSTGNHSSTVAKLTRSSVSQAVGSRGRR